MTNTPKNWEKEMIERFWAVHSSTMLSKDDWTLEKSVEALIPMIVRETELETSRNISIAASAAGLAPKDLAKAEDWKNAVKKILNSGKRMYEIGKEDGRSEVIEEVENNPIVKEFLEGTPHWLKDMSRYDEDMCFLCGMRPEKIKALYELLTSLKSKETPKE